jgi:hypothetical protein
MDCLTARNIRRLMGTDVYCLDCPDVQYKLTNELTIGHRPSVDISVGAEGGKSTAGGARNY